MNKIIADTQETYSDICSQQFVELFKNYFNDSNYLSLFQKQFYSMLKNLQSIEALLRIKNVEDAFSIFRKYIETYILSICILENPNLAAKYLVHEKYLGYKSNNTNHQELREFYRDKPDGYLSYGFIEGLVDSSDEDFRYTIRNVAEVAGIPSYYDWYRISNNFVHNNTTGINVSIEEGTTKLIGLLKTSTKHYIQRLLEIINKIS